MERALALETTKKVGQEVLLKGWLNRRRDHGKVIFLDLRDRSGVVQLVANVEGLEAGVQRLVEQLRSEFVVEVTGEVVGRSEKDTHPDLATGKIEVKVKDIKVLSTAAADFPISLTEWGGETDQQLRLDWRFIDLRKPEKRLIFQVWTEMEQGFRDYWVENGYVQIHSPKLMGAASESGGELFEVKYFDRFAYLAQSPQFYKQMAMAAGFERVFEIGPVFRANPSFTSRHDTEFTMYDLEISFVDSHLDVMRQEEQAIAHALTGVVEKYGPEIEERYGRKLRLPSLPFPQLTMKEAKEILANLNVPREKLGDLSPEEERALGKYIYEKYGHEFVFVTEYPVAERPFYHMRLESDSNLTKSFDLLWNGLEVTTGAQREHRLEVLESQAKEKGISLDPIRFYLDFFKYGCPPHGGCALGPTRMLMKIFNIANVREVTYLYRGVNRLSP